MLNDIAGLLPDMTLQFTCEYQEIYDRFSAQLLIFLEERDFCAIDLRSIQINAGLRTSFDEYVVGLNNGTIVKSVKLPGVREGLLSVITGSPTIHSTELEDELFSFFKDHGECAVSNEHRYDNTSAAQGTYARELARVKKLLDEAEQVQR